MNSIIDIAFPIFGLGMLGYFVSRLGYFPDQATDGLSRFVFEIAVPVMLVRVFSNTQLPENIPWALLGSFYVPIYIIYLIGITVSMRFFRRSFVESVITGLGCAFGNLILLGLPLALRTFGEQAAVPFFIVVSLHGVSFYAITTILLETGRNHGGTGVLVKILKGMLTNPILIAIVIGLLLNMLDVRLARPLDQLAQYMQQAVAPCALFTLGASLTRYHIAGQIKESVFIIIMKNIIFPLLVWFIAQKLLVLEPLWAMVVILMAAQPTGVTLFIFANRYKVNLPLAATSILLSSVVSMLTITCILYFFTTMGLKPGG